MNNFLSRYITVNNSFVSNRKKHPIFFYNFSNFFRQSKQSKQHSVCTRKYRIEFSLVGSQTTSRKHFRPRVHECLAEGERIIVFEP